MPIQRDESYLACRTLDAVVITKVWGWAILWSYDPVFGQTLYLYDPTAVRTSDHSTSARLLGGRWERGYHEDGTPFEFFGRLAPFYSSQCIDCYELEEEIERRGPELRDRYVRQLIDHTCKQLARFDLGRGLDESDIWAIAHASPRQRVEALIAAIDKKP